MMLRKYTRDGAVPQWDFFYPTLNACGHLPRGIATCFGREISLQPISANNGLSGGRLLDTEWTTR